MPAREKFPARTGGAESFDLESGRYLKVWQGPQHPGITGNMSLELVISGDEIVDLKTHVGYLHRGFEKLMERRKWIQNFPLVCRICVPEPDFNEYLYAAATEELSGIVIPERAVWLRGLNLEMARLTSYLMWIGGQAGAFGMGTIGQWTVTMRDFMLDLFEQLSGGRIYHMYIVPGGVRGDVPAGWFKNVLDTLKNVEKVMNDVELVLFNNAVFKMRAKGLGVITPDMVDHYGITGPNARAAGIHRDLRIDRPYLVYDQLDFEIITGDKLGVDSDAYGRLQCRAAEMRQSISLIRQMIEGMPEGPVHEAPPNVLHWKIPAGETYLAAECTRGEYGYYVVSDGSDKPRRVYVRGPSYTHAVALLEELGPGTNIADTAGLMVSLHTYPPEIER
jgi:NADH-quinone oxidoreductase subunit D